MKKIYLSAIAISVLSSSALFGASDFSSAFQSGKTSGQIRYMYMQDDNAPGLQDYFGSAIGGHLKYETGAFYDFKFGVAFYTTNLINGNANSQYKESTSPSHPYSRYVMRLVDTVNPDNRAVNGVGQLYLKYHHSKTEVTLGRMELKTPLLNPEDGWMIPSLFQGLWVKSKDVKGFVLQAGFINGVWVRNTPGWKSVEDSLGYGYGQGSQPIAAPHTPGNYYGHTSSDGIYAAGATYVKVHGLKLQAWDYFVQNIYNTVYLESKYKKRFDKYKFLVGLQYLDQRAVGDGGNSNPAEAFMKPHEISHTFGGIIGAGYAGSMLSLAGMTTGKQGRLMMPREWGKPPLYTFQNLETADGEGGDSAWVVRYKQNYGFLGLHGLNTNVSYGRHYLQDAKNFVLNKYGFPSYSEVTAAVLYNFGGALKGLHARYLIMRKDAIAETYQTATNSSFVFCKNGQTVQEFVLNYNF